MLSLDIKILSYYSVWLMTPGMKIKAITKSQ